MTANATQFEITEEEMNQLVKVVHYEVTETPAGFTRKVQIEVDDRLIAEAELGRACAASMEALIDIHLGKQTIKDSQDIDTTLRATMKLLNSRLSLQMHAEKADRAYSKLLAARAVAADRAEAATDGDAATQG